MENELDLRERICRAFTTDITVAGGAREAVIANFFLALILIFSTDSGLVILSVIIVFTFSHGYIEIICIIYCLGLVILKIKIFMFQKK